MPLMSKARRNARLTNIVLVAFAVVLATALLYWRRSGSLVVRRDAADSTNTHLTASRMSTAPVSECHSCGGGVERGDSSQATVVPHLGREESKSMLWSIFGKLPVWAMSTGRGGHASAETFPELDFIVTNFYHERDGKPGAQIPWLDGVKLAEPYRDTTLRVVNPRKGYRYTWTIWSSDDSKHVLARATGAEAIVSFTRLDLNVVSLAESREKAGQIVREKTDTVTVKYVRREIRTLTDADREELLDAVSEA